MCLHILKTYNLFRKKCLFFVLPLSHQFIINIHLILNILERHQCSFTFLLFFIFWLMVVITLFSSSFVKQIYWLKLRSSLPIWIVYLYLWTNLIAKSLNLHLIYFLSLSLSTLNLSNEKQRIITCKFENLLNDKNQN